MIEQNNTIENFLSMYIDGYLMKDLENMAKIRLEDGEDCGACNYPMMLTIISGMELLGGIISSKPITKASLLSSKKFFRDYWNNFFAKRYPKYNIPNISSLIYKLVRNSIAHTFLAKPGILITKGCKQYHMQFDKEEKLIVIDATELMRDFQDTYSKLVKPIALGTKKSKFASLEDIKRRINEIATIYTEESATFFQNISKKTSANENSFSINSTAGSPAQPISSFIYNASCSNFSRKSLKHAELH